MRNRHLLLRSRTLGRLLAVLGVAFVGVGITAFPASAHTPELTASATCDGVVTYHAKTWQQGTSEDQKTNDHVEVQAYLGGKWITKDTGSFNINNGYQFGDQIDGLANPGAFPLQMKLVVGQWKDKTPGGSTSPITVNLPSNCGQDKAPQATITHDCAKYTVSLDNSKSDTETTFVVNVNGKDVDTVKVAAHGTGTSTGAVQPNTDYDIRVTVNGKLIARYCFDTNDCDQTKPAVDLTVDCDHYTVTVRNPGKTDIDYTVNQEGAGNVKSGTIKPGETATYTSPTLDKDVYRVKVFSGGVTILDRLVEIKGCTTTPPAGTPTATVKADCDNWTVTVANAGGGTTKIPFDVIVNGVSQTVQADNTPVDVTGKTKQGVVNTFVVKQNGQTIKDEKFDATKCSSTQPPKDTPKASLTVDCKGYTATFDNTGSTVDTTYTVTFSGITQTPETVVVPKGQTVTKTYPVTKGETVAISAPGLTTPVSQTFNEDCASVSPPPSQPSTGGGTNSPTSTTSTTSSPTTTSSGGSTSALPSTGNDVSQMVLMAGLGLLGVGVVMMMLSRIKPLEA